MRKPFHNQRSLFCQWPNHQFTDELREISAILDEHPDFIRWVHADVCPETITDTGSHGMTAEQVLRAAIIKQQNAWSYDFLAVQCADSGMTKAFVRLDYGETYSKSCLHENISRIRSETWMRINDALVLSAKEKKIESGRTVRMDATVIESNILSPSDSSLLYDCVRVVCHALDSLKKQTGIRFKSNISPKNAKRMRLSIMNANGAVKRKAIYKNMLAECKKLNARLPGWISKFGSLELESGDLDRLVKVSSLLPLIIDQTHRRVIKEETVPSNEKIVSIFEDHTDIIVKGRREVEYGHKAFFTAGESGMVLHCQLVQGNPSDSEYFIDLIEKQRDLYGKVPRQTTADGGFASEDNVFDAQDLGVKDVCFSKPCGIPVEEMCKSRWVFQKLRNFRAGIEAVISVLKRSFGLSRALWKGAKGFGAYVHSAVCAYNLTIMARRTLEVT